MRLAQACATWSRTCVELRSATLHLRPNVGDVEAQLAALPHPADLEARRRRLALPRATRRAGRARRRRAEALRRTRRSRRAGCTACRCGRRSSPGAAQTSSIGAERIFEQLTRVRWIVCPLGHALLDEVPVLVERHRQRAERRGLHARGEEQEQRSLEVRVGEQLVAERGPATVELDAGADLVEHLDPRREAGLDGVLREDPLGERVQGADGGAVELVERGAGSARRSLDRPSPRRAPRARGGCGRAARPRPSR